MGDQVGTDPRLHEVRVRLEEIQKLAVTAADKSQRESAVSAGSPVGRAAGAEMRETRPRRGGGLFFAGLVVVTLATALVVTWQVRDELPEPVRAALASLGDLSNLADDTPPSVAAPTDLIQPSSQPESGSSQSEPPRVPAEPTQTEATSPRPTPTESSRPEVAANARTPVAAVRRELASGAREESLAAAATKLISSGMVAEAREKLLAAEPITETAVAWALARSYDPRYLATIESPNAAPDAAQAEHWYRQWRDLALADGLISETFDFRRLIRGMKP